MRPARARSRSGTRRRRNALRVGQHERDEVRIGAALAKPVDRALASRAVATGVDFVRLLRLGIKHTPLKRLAARPRQPSTEGRALDA
jgi:hypothetical protein